MVAKDIAGNPPTYGSVHFLLDGTESYYFNRSQRKNAGEGWKEK